MYVYVRSWIKVTFLFHIAVTSGEPSSFNQSLSRPKSTLRSLPIWTITIPNSLSFLLIFFLESIKVLPLEKEESFGIQRRQIAVLRARTIIYMESKEE